MVVYGLKRTNFLSLVGPNGPSAGDKAKAVPCFPVGCHRGGVFFATSCEKMGDPKKESFTARGQEDPPGVSKAC